MRKIEDAKCAAKARALSSLLAELDRLDDTDQDRRFSLKHKAINTLEPQFRREQQQAVDRQNAITARLVYQLNHIHVPSPRTVYHRVFIGGMFYTSADAERDLARGLKDPFTGRPFDLMVGCGSKSWATEALRVSADHILSKGNELSSATQEQLAGLKGMRVDSIVCHSNGCAIARTLIQIGFVNGVKELRVLGGDDAITDLDGLRALQSSTKTKVSVYAVIGDPIPLTPTGWQIIEATKRIGPLQTFADATSLTYEVLGLKRRKGFDLFCCHPHAEWQFTQETLMERTLTCRLFTMSLIV